MFGDWYDCPWYWDYISISLSIDRGGLAPFICDIVLLLELSEPDFSCNKYP